MRQLSWLCLLMLAWAGCERPAEFAAPTAVAAPYGAKMGGEWPGWRGPVGRGVAEQFPRAWQWPRQAPALVWEQPTGDGWSSPVVADGRVFVTDRQGDKERLLAFDADRGKRLWVVENRVDFEPHPVGRKHGNGPKSTPVVADGKVYSLGIAGYLQCVDAANGKRLWQHDLPAEFSESVPLADGRAYVDGTRSVVVPTTAGQGGRAPLFGYTGSLLAIDGKIVLSVGGERGGTVMAFDAPTGKVVWQALREHVSYSSPVAAMLAGVEQVVVMTGPRVVGLRLADGKLLWSHPFQIQYDESISTPAIADDLVLVTGDGKPLTGLRIATAGEGQQASVAWDNVDLTSYLSSMLVHEGHVYGMADDGQFACVRLSDGKTLWQGGDHGYYASPVLAGDRLLALNEEGSVALLAANPARYAELGQWKLAAGATWTMPAIAGGRIFVRSADRLACFDLSAP
ncbi:MAG: PQQ-binding-like beta-propeller repeat protein [Pirellulales bacterium]|nr:PQQ-binding-like beta-propeller repeat protein [Pirellulales bacterium]